jgi:hypothetical protein
MDEAARDRVQQEIEHEANERFPGAVQSVVVLRHGDHPVVEPGELIVRVLIRPEGPDDGEQRLRAFEQAHRPEMEQFRREVSRRVPQARRLQFIRDDGSSDRKMIMMPLGGGVGVRGPEGSPAAGDLTPVMARLGPADLETVDTLITAGIAANRAEAVRWALARVRERPAYAQLRERISEIDRLKAEF